MTKELEREAKDYTNDWLGEVHELELKHRTDSKPEYIRIQQAYLAGAEPREKRIEELAMRLEDTEKELADYHIKYLFFKKLSKENAELKELIKNIIRVTWGEGWNYSLDWKVKAEQFLKKEAEE